MRRYSDGFPLVLAVGVFSLAALGKSIYEDAAKAWVLARLTQWGYGPEAAAFTNGLVEVAPAFGLAGAVVWFLHRYIKREFERTSLAFKRKLEIPDGDLGHYRAYLTVTNTSSTEKLLNCRCEIVELRNEAGELMETQIGLRTKNQENKENKGRFNLDQGAVKEVPLFDIDQQYDQLVVINADERDLRFDGGVYTAKIRGYGDRGLADEIIVRLDTSNCAFTFVSTSP